MDYPIRRTLQSRFALARRFGIGLPQKLLPSLREYLRTNRTLGGQMQVLAPPCVEYFDPPQPLAPEFANERITSAFSPTLKSPLPPWELARIPGAGVFGRELFVSTPDRDALFIENATYEKILDRTGKFALRRYATHRLPGASLLAFNHQAEKNYYHWMLEALPRFLALDSIDEPVRVLVPSNAARFVADSLELLGIVREDQPLTALEDAYYECDTLYYSGGRHRRGIPSRPATLAVRDRLISASKQGNSRFPKRIYVSRQDSPRRPITNEDELSEKLKANGIESVTPGSFSLEEQVQMFAGAELIVGIHGAGMTNTMFCKPGTPFIEIFTDRVVGHFWRLAQLLELDWRYVAGERSANGALENVDAIVSSIRDL